MFASKLVSTRITVQVVYSTDYLLFDRSMRTKTNCTLRKRHRLNPKTRYQSRQKRIATRRQVIFSTPTPQHLQQYFPYRRIYIRAYNADNRRSVAGVADVRLQLKTPPCKGSKGTNANADVGFPTFSGCHAVSQTQKLRKLEDWEDALDESGHGASERGWLLPGRETYLLINVNSWPLTATPRKIAGPVYRGFRAWR